MICEPRNSRLGLFGKEPKQEEEIEARPAYTASPTSLDKLIDQMFTNGQTMNKLVDEGSMPLSDCRSLNTSTSLPK